MARAEAIPLRQTGRGSAFALPAPDSSAARSDGGQVAESPTPGQRDRALVDRHVAGDPQAFEDFYHEYAGMIFNIALRQSGDPELARDLAQEAFIRLFRNLRKFQGRSSLKTWVYRVVLNHCRSRLSRRKVPLQPLLDDQGRERDLLDERRGPEEQAEASSSRDLIQQALLEVDPTYREALVLRDLEELSYQEIAEVLDVPVGTVRSRIARGRDRLKTAVERIHVASGGTRAVADGGSVREGRT